MVVHVYGADGAYRGWRAYSRMFSSDDLYTVNEGGERDVRTEKALKFIEDEFLRVRGALEYKKPLPTGTKAILACYTAAMRNRSPTARDHWQSFKDRVVDLGDQMATALAAASPSERQRMTAASRHSVPDSSGSMTLGEAKEAAAQPFGAWVLRHIGIEAQLLQKMNFAILEAPEGVGFITSDNPVVWHDAAPHQKRRHFGLAHPHIEVTMPLSPRYCVMFDHAGKDGRGKLDQAAVDLLNSRTLRQAGDCFIAQSGELVVDWPEEPEQQRE